MAGENRNFDIEFEQIIRSVLDKHAVTFISNRVQDAKEENLNSLSFLKSFVSQVSDSGDGQMGTLSIGFNQSGRFQDLKRNKGRWGENQPPVEKLKAWIYRRGAAPFIAKYKRGKGTLSNDKIIENVAWAIAKTIKKKGNTPRRWWSARRIKDINIIFDELVEAYRDLLIKFQKESLENGIK